MDPYLIPYIEIHPKWIEYQALRANILKVLEENIGTSCHDKYTQIPDEAHEKILNIRSH